MKILRAIACAAAIMLGVGGLGQVQAAKAFNLNDLSAEIVTPEKYVHKTTYYDCPPYYGYSYYPYRRGHYYPYRRHYGYYGGRHYYPYRRHYGYYGRRHYGYGHRHHHRRHY